MNQWSYAYTVPLVHLRDPYESPYKAVIYINQGTRTDELAHYGIKGQRWGVITKEYEPVSVDHRRTGIVQNNVKSIDNYKKQYSKQEKEGYWTKENGRTVWRQNGKSISPSAERQKIVEKALIGAGILTALLATYGVMKYRHVQKAKAYSGILSRFLDQNKKLNNGGKLNENLLFRGSELARKNSKKFSDAVRTNKYLKSRGLKPTRKDALRIYKAGRSIDKLSKVKIGSNSLTKHINKLRRQALSKKILSNFGI